MKYSRFEELPVWKHAIELARRMYAFIAIDPFRLHPGLRDQLERATLSISNNVAEGFERGSTNELLAFLYIARGSAGEVRSMLSVLEDWSAFGNFKSQISDLKIESENISKQLYKWIESLKSSDIRGQRHLDDKTRMRLEARKERESFLEELRHLNEIAAERRHVQHSET